MSKHIPDDKLSVPAIELGLYEHYKGGRYEVIGVGLDSETLEPVVIYKPLRDSQIPFWVRPYDMFISKVEVNGKEISRFKKA